MWGREQGAGLPAVRAAGSAALQPPRWAGALGLQSLPGEPVPLSALRSRLAERVSRGPAGPLRPLRCGRGGGPSRLTISESSMPGTGVYWRRHRFGRKLMKWAMRGLGMVVALVLAGCSSVPVSSDYNVEYSFDQARRYAWLEPRSEGADPRIQNDLVDARERRAVDDQLRARGLSRADAPDQADLLVPYHMGQEEKLDVRTSRSHFGYYPCWHCYGPYWGPSWGYGDDLWVTEYTQGTLVIDLIDARSRKLDRKSTRLNSSHVAISYAVFCLKKKQNQP